MVAIAVAVAALAALPQTVDAAQLRIDSITGIWTDAEGAPVDGLGTTRIDWGVPLTAAGSSAYAFEGAAPAAIGPFAPGETFDIGTFFHYNFPIDDQLLNGATLDLVIAGRVFPEPAATGSAFLVEQALRFDHQETFNLDDPCPGGTANGIGANVAGCADIVTIGTALPRSEAFVRDDQTFLFSLTGFEGGEASFLTSEATINSVPLTASFLVVEGAADVPVPASLPLLASLIGALGSFGWLRKRAAQS
ncbi:hypothetical protein LNKW23_16690 [Paralimibaculum aggregatum]|uniref:PEP-CTERM sorting domain-containing protein n=2 Tax=Paralimibaculum aggregatum TaxID=3036245 RepID=A0ABQ6LGM5_9RHOB|nr:hypothetical protein LNKW23_16690 [Limibaculum sp. NKW23]